MSNVGSPPVDSDSHYTEICIGYFEFHMLWNILIRIEFVIYRSYTKNYQNFHKNRDFTTSIYKYFIGNISYSLHIEYNKY